jgi:hypothetical protein
MVVLVVFDEVGAETREAAAVPAVEDILVDGLAFPLLLALPDCDQETEELGLRVGEAEGLGHLLRRVPAQGPLADDDDVEEIAGVGDARLAGELAIGVAGVASLLPLETVLQEQAEIVTFDFLKRENVAKLNQK